MKKSSKYIIVFLIGLLLGFTGSQYLIKPVRIISSDTTVVETIESSWVYPPIQEQEIQGEILHSDTPTIQDSIHQITFTVNEGTADIEYNIQTRHGTLTWMPAPVLREHVHTIQTVEYQEPIPLQQPVYFHKPSFVGGIVTGCVATVGLIYLVSGVL